MWTFHSFPVLKQQDTHIQNIDLLSIVHQLYTKRSFVMWVHLKLRIQLKYEWPYRMKFKKGG